jgi:hypothetical protein
MLMPGDIAIASFSSKSVGRSRTCRRRAYSRATAWPPTCPTSPRPWSPSWRW